MIFPMTRRPKLLTEYDSFSETLIPYDTGDRWIGIPPLKGFNGFREGQDRNH